MLLKIKYILLFGTSENNIFFSCNSQPDTVYRGFRSGVSN